MLGGVIAAAAAVTYGSIKVSGQVSGNYQIQGQCKTFSGLSGTFVTLDPYALNSPTLSITGPAGASAKNLSLAHSTTFDVEYETVAGLSWLAGFSGGTSDLGSGTLTMAAGGRSGSVSAKLQPYRTSATRAIEVVASWNCASDSTTSTPPKTTVPVTTPPATAVNTLHLSGLINGNFQMDKSDSCSSLTEGTFSIWLLAYNSAGNHADIYLNGYLPGLAQSGSGITTFPTNAGGEITLDAGDYAWEVGKQGSGAVGFSKSGKDGTVDLALAPEPGGPATSTEHVSGRWAC